MISSHRISSESWECVCSVRNPHLETRTRPTGRLWVRPVFWWNASSLLCKKEIVFCHLCSFLLCLCSTVAHTALFCSLRKGKNQNKMWFFRTQLDESMQPLRPYEKYDTLRQFLDHDQHVLRFYCFWDDSESMFGEKRDLILHYFLADDTIEIREIIPPNSGRDAVPTFLRRGKLPKTVEDLKQPGVATDRTVLNVFGPTGHGGRYILDSLKVLVLNCGCRWILKSMQHNFWKTPRVKFISSDRSCARWLLQRQRFGHWSCNQCLGTQSSFVRLWWIHKGVLQNQVWRRWVPHQIHSENSKHFSPNTYMHKLCFLFVFVLQRISHQSSPKLRRRIEQSRKCRRTTGLATRRTPSALARACCRSHQNATFWSLWKVIVRAWKVTSCASWPSLTRLTRSTRSGGSSSRFTWAMTASSCSNRQFATRVRCVKPFLHMFVSLVEIGSRITTFLSSRSGSADRTCA